MARPKRIIHVDVEPIGSDGTEADMMRWVRATRILLTAKARRDARFASQVLDETNAETKTPSLETTKDDHEL